MKNLSSFPRARCVPASVRTGGASGGCSHVPSATRFLRQVWSAENRRARQAPLTPRPPASSLPQGGGGFSTWPGPAPDQTVASAFRSASCGGTAPSSAHLLSMASRSFQSDWRADLDLSLRPCPRAGSLDFRNSATPPSDHPSKMQAFMISYIVTTRLQTEHTPTSWRQEPSTEDSGSGRRLTLKGPSASSGHTPDGWRSAMTLSPQRCLL